MEEPAIGGKLKPSHKAIWVVVGLLILAKLLETFIHVPFTNASQQAIFSWKSLAFFVALLLLGSGFAHIIGFPGMWDEQVTNRRRILVPVAIGLVVGVALLAADLSVGFSRLFAAAAGTPTLAVPFPYSLLVQGYAAICTAILFTLFGVSFLLWFFGTLLLARRWPNVIFWVIALIAAALEPFSYAAPRDWGLFHVAPVSAGLVAVLVLVYVMNLAGAVLLRRFGFTAALVMRVSAVAVWHIIGRI